MTDKPYDGYEEFDAAGWRFNVVGKPEPRADVGYPRVPQRSFKEQLRICNRPRNRLARRIRKYHHEEE